MSLSTSEGPVTAAANAVNEVATATGAALNSAVTATGDAIDALLPETPKEGPAAQRAFMLAQTGTAHFSNPELIAGRDHMAATRTPFDERKSRLVSSQFVASRDRFRGGKAVPQRGPVLGGTAGDTMTALAILAASQGGVPVLGSQPILAALLPGWGY